MKSFVTFVVVLAVVGDVLAQGMTDEQKTKLKEFKESCVTETGVDEAVLERAKKGDIVTGDEKLNCFTACMLKKVEILKSDGTIDEAIIRAKAPADVPQEKIDELIKNCQNQVGSNDCETGGKILGCMMNTPIMNVFQ